MLHHNLINEDTPAGRVTPIEHMAEACLRLVQGDPKNLTGLITYADEVMQQFDLVAQTLPPLHGI